MQNVPDRDLTLKLESAPRGTIYLSVSWQPDKGKDFGYRVIRRLDSAKYLAVGDTKDFDEMDRGRIKRIMSRTDAFLSVLPYRPDKPSKTSGFMLDELDIAIECRLPIAVIYDSRIIIKKTEDSVQQVVTLGFPDGRAFTLAKALLVSDAAFDFGVETSEELSLIHLGDFLSKATSPASQNPPYSFLVSRLQPDFRLPRIACQAAAERASGFPCLWIDSPEYVSNVDDTVERARLLIKNAEFVVAEISLTEESPEFDNPNRAHEIGIATAYRKSIFLVSHEPRRHPYHGLISQQLTWWQQEADLFKGLKSAVYAKRGDVGRHVYNWELEDLRDGAPPNFAAPRFDPSVGAPWVPPTSLGEQQAQSWIYAVSFSVIVGCIAILLRRGVGYEDTFDLVAIFATLVTFLFSSSLNRSIQAGLIRIRYLKWLVPLLAGLLLAATIIFLRPKAVAQKPASHPANVLDKEEKMEGMRPPTVEPS